MTELSQKDLHDLFQSIDRELARRRRPALRITILGGASIILLGFRERATRDIDIAPTADAHLFQKLCRPRGIPVDIVTVCSTVDLHHCATTPVFKGKLLAMHSVTIEDLLKLKLERFRKHDPEDIYAILQRTGLPFNQFKAAVKEMLLDFVGNPRELALSACLVVERIYPEHLDDFEKTVLPQP